MATAEAPMGLYATPASRLLERAPQEPDSLIASATAFLNKRPTSRGVWLVPVRRETGPAGRWQPVEGWDTLRQEGGPVTTDQDGLRSDVAFDFAKVPEQTEAAMILFLVWGPKPTFGSDALVLRAAEAPVDPQGPLTPDQIRAALADALEKLGFPPMLGRPS